MESAVLLLEWAAIASLALLLATWVIYPLAIHALGRRSGTTRAPVALHRLPSVSIVIATRDHDEAVESRVRDCLDADYPGNLLHVSVGLDRADPGGALAAALASLPRVHLVPADAPGGKACALNAAVRAARGDVLIFADTSQRFRRDAVRRLVERLAEPDVGAVSGRLELAPREGGPSLAEIYWAYESRLRRDEAAVHSVVGATGAIYGIRSAHWGSLPAGLLLDDVYTPMRIALAGFRVAYEDTARAIELRRIDAAGEYHRKVRTLTGVLQLCRLLPQLLAPSRNPLWMQFVSHKLLRLGTPFATVVLVAGAATSAVHRLGALTVLAGSLTALLVAAAWPSRRRGLATSRALLRDAVLMHAAILVALGNGIRGQWNVWRQ